MRFLFFLIVFVNIALSQDIALLIGVGKFKEKNIVKYTMDMSKDIPKARAIVKVLGDYKIDEMIDQKATRDSIINYIKRYIKSPNNTKNSNFLLYYSGHGLQVKDISGDESDKKDEAFALYDAKVSKMPFSSDITIDGGVIIDDELYALLSQIKAKKILIFDKCNADTSDRGALPKPIVIKNISGDFVLSKSFYKYIKITQNGFDFADNSSVYKNYIVLSAVQDKERATYNNITGSFFTLSLYDAIVKGKVSPNATIKELLEFSKNEMDELSNQTDQPQYFSPAIRPYSLLNKSIKDILGIHTTSTQTTPLLEETLDSFQAKSILSLDINKDIYYLDDKIEFEIRSKKSGYITVFINYPNRYDIFAQNIKIKANRLYRFPSSFIKDKILVASQPKGDTKIYVLLSKNKIDIKSYLNTKSKRDNLKATNYIRKELAYYAQEIDKTDTKQKIQKQKKGYNILDIGTVRFDVK